MSDYYGTGRSNYFKVKDLEDFKAFCTKADLEMVPADDGSLCVISNQDDGDFRIPADDPDEGDLDFPKELSSHLKEGEVAVLMHVGAEKARYVGGYAVAVDWRGDEVWVELGEIYSLAERRFGIKPSECEY